MVVSVYKQSETADDVTLRFEVHDTGIGISEEAQLRLFNPFVQADGSMTRKYGGTGLGLAICAQIVEQMKGRIWLSSAPGKGSGFKFTATFARAGDEMMDYTEISAALAHSRILIVDDNESNRKMLHHQLSSWQIAHDAVDSGAAALDALRREAEAGHPYDIALLDMCMPGMNGIELASAIRADWRIASTRLLMLSSAVGRSVEDRTVEGIDAWLNKPVKQSQLFDCLIKLVSGSAEAAGAPLSSGSKPEPDMPSATEPPVAPVRILVAEDNVTNQKVALGLLRKLGYQAADTVANGVEVVEALTRVPYDIVLMDCQMPEMDGYEATAEIRRRERDKQHTIVVAMTAHALTGEREKCLAAGMDDYLTKPVKLQELGAMLRRWSEAAAGARGHPGNTNRTDPLDLEVLAVLRAYQGEGDADLATEVIDSYLADLDRLIPQMRTAARERNYQQLKQIAHALKGCSGSVGATGLVRLGQEIELMAARADAQTVELLIDRIATESQRVRDVLAAQRIC